MVDHAHPDADARIAQDEGEESFPALGSERLGVVDALQRRLIQWPHTRSRYDGAGQRSATRLIDARNASGAVGPLDGAAA
jgi:hypothetical protein